MLVLGLMWVASWFGGFPDLGHRLVETPKFLINVLSRDITPTSKLVSHPVPTALDVAQISPRFKLSNTFATNFAKPDRSEPANWLETIETLLFTPDSNNVDQEFQSDADDRPFSQFLGTVQSLLWSLPGFNVEDFQNAVAVVEIGNDGSILEPKNIPIQRFGFWQCPTWSSRSSKQSATGGFQIWVKGCHVATLPDRETATAIAANLRQVMDDPTFDASELRAAMAGSQPIGKMGSWTIFSISEELAQQLHRPAELIAIEWLNNLRVALGQSEINLAEAQVQMHGLETTNGSINGMASWYGPYFHGRQTANGEIFNQHDLTAAHPSLPLGTFLKVTNRLNGKSIVVRVNDRGPYFDNRVLDLSNRAAQMIDSEDKGVVPIEAIVMQPLVTAQKTSPQKIARVITGY